MVKRQVSDLALLLVRDMGLDPVSDEGAGQRHGGSGPRVRSIAMPPNRSATAMPLQAGGDKARRHGGRNDHGASP